MGFQPEQPVRVREHRLRVRLRETLSPQHVEKDLRVPAGHVGLRLVIGGPVAEIPPAVDHLFGHGDASWRAK